MTSEEPCQLASRTAAGEIRSVKAGRRCLVLVDSLIKYFDRIDGVDAMRGGA